jgi:hypothetical protein
MTKVLPISMDAGSNLTVGWVRGYRRLEERDDPDGGRRVVLGVIGGLEVRLDVVAILHLQDAVAARDVAGQAAAQRQPLLVPEDARIGAGLLQGDALPIAGVAVEHDHRDLLHQVRLEVERGILQLDEDVHAHLVFS